MSDLQSPYPYFGGKRKIAELVWERFGIVRNTVEPFFGSGAFLLSRPELPGGGFGIETVNDLNGFIPNFWRAIKADPDAVAEHADWPVSECCLHARHALLVSQKDSLQSRLEGDPEFYDAKIAGWWVWGMSIWIGGGFCAGVGPWHVEEIDGVKQLVNGGVGGIQRRRPHMGDGRGIARKRPIIAGPAGGSVLPTCDALHEYFDALSNRLRRVRVCCGDWTRVCGPSVTHKHGVTAVFLDPPYSAEAGRDPDIYTVDCLQVAHDARAWALANGNNPLMRVALCGYEGEHEMPGWDCVAWNAGMGYGARGQDGVQTDNGKRERVWFSPHCVEPKQHELTL